MYIAPQQLQFQIQDPEIMLELRWEEYEARDRLHTALLYHGKAQKFFEGTIAITKSFYEGSSVTQQRCSLFLSNLLYHSSHIVYGQVMLSASR